MKAQIDYEALATDAPRAARKLIDALARAGLPIVEASSDGEVKRAAGVTTRELVLSFVDSQAVTLRVKSSGDVFQVLVNGRVVPIAEQDDVAGAAREIAMQLDRTRESFQKRLSLLKMMPPEGMRTTAPRMEVALLKQVAEVDAQIAVARREVADLEHKLDAEVAH